MSEPQVPEDFQYGDYDLEEDVTPVPASEALDYPDVAQHDDQTAPVGFTSVEGVTPQQAIATARSWSLSRRFVGVGQCLATVRQYYGVPAGFPTAAASYAAADHKHLVSTGVDVPRGAPVWWTGGSHGAGHVAISVGGGICLSTDWKEQGKIDYARIDEITSRWGLSFKGYTEEVNAVVVWRPQPALSTINLNNLKPGKRNDDVLRLKRRLREKGYKGFIVSSRKFGKGIQNAYAQYQRRLGYTGHDANGIPGVKSLRKLGFAVKS